MAGSVPERRNPCPPSAGVRDLAHTPQSPLLPSPAMMLLRARLVLLVGLGACNSDDTGAITEGSSTSTGDLGSSTSSTGVPTTTGGESSSSTTGLIHETTGDSTTEPTTGEPEQSCRDALMCFSDCALTLDLACFQGCAEGLPPEEGMKALALGSCIVQGCFGTGACSVDTLQDPLCLACIGFGLLSESSPGCEEQGAACN